MRITSHFLAVVWLFLIPAVGFSQLTCGDLLAPSLGSATDASGRLILTYKLLGKSQSLEVSKRAAFFKYVAPVTPETHVLMESLGTIEKFPGQESNAFLLIFQDESTWQKLFELKEKRLLAFVTPPLRQPSSVGLETFITDQLFVRFKQAPTADELQAFTQTMHLEVLKQNTFIKSQYHFSYKNSVGLALFELIEQLGKRAEVSLVGWSGYSGWKTPTGGSVDLSHIF